MASDLERACALWAAYRDDPLRRDLLAAAADAFVAEREAAPARTADGLVRQLRAALAVDHLAWIATRRLHPRLIVLLVEAGRIPADDAPAMLALQYTGGPEALVRLAPRLSRPVLRDALARLPWGGYIACPEEQLAALLRRVAGDDWDPAGLADRAREPGRARLLAALLPALAPGPRAAAVAAIRARLAALADPFDALALAREVQPDTLAGLFPSDLRAWIEPRLADEWDRLDAIADPVARAEAWEGRVAALGPLAAAADTRRWLAAIVDVVAAHPDQSFRLQTGAPARLHAAIVAALPPARAAEARTWLVWGDPAGDVDAALRAVLAADLDPADRRRLLALLAARTPAAAVALRAAPGVTRDESLLALLHAPDPAAVDEILHDVPFDSETRGPAHAGPRLLDMLLRLAGAPDDLRERSDLAPLAPPAAAGLVALAREAVQARDPPARARALLAFAAHMPADTREALADAVLADPGAPPGDLAAALAALPPARREAALAGPLARVLARTDARDRVRALGELLSAFPDAPARLRELYRDRRARGLLDPAEVCLLPRDALDLDLRRDLVAEELAHPRRPYTAWLLGTGARHLPAAERAPVLARALDEFTAIVATPTGPGNDAGPFVDMADLLDAPQARRALAICDAMAAAADWGEDLAHARQHLWLRLAALGHDAEAGVALAAQSPPEHRAWGLGARLGQKLARGAPWSAAAAAELHAAAGPAPSDDLRHAALTGLLWALDSAPPPVAPAPPDPPPVPSDTSPVPPDISVPPVPPDTPPVPPDTSAQPVPPDTPPVPPDTSTARAELALGLLAAVDDLADPELRAGAIAWLLRTFLADLPPSRWAAEIAARADGDARRSALIDLAGRLAPARAAEVARAAVADLDPARALEDDMDELCRLAPHLPTDLRCDLLATWLRTFPRRGRSLIAALCDEPLGAEIAALLRVLGGDAAVLAAARTIAGLPRLLA